MLIYVNYLVTMLWNSWLLTPTAGTMHKRGRSTLTSFTQDFMLAKWQDVNHPQLAAKGTEIQPTFFGLESRWCNILGMCDQGTAALGQLFKDAEKDPYAFPWDVMAAQVEFFEMKRVDQRCALRTPNKSFSIIGIIWYHLDTTIEPTWNQYIGP